MDLLASKECIHVACSKAWGFACTLLYFHFVNCIMVEGLCCVVNVGLLLCNGQSLLKLG